MGMNRMIMIWFAFSTLFSSIGLVALRRANLPVSDMVMGYFELLIPLFPACSVVYALLSFILFEVDPEIKDSPIYKDILKSLEDSSIKLASAFAICAAILQYFGFSYNPWISYLLYAVLVLAREVKPDLGVSESWLYWPLVSLFLFFPAIHIVSIVILIPVFHLLVAEPYFRNLNATSSMAAQAYGQRRYIEIVCGMLGNALTAYYLRFQSADLMLAFLSFAVASLGILANVKPSTDFGIIQFLVTSSIQCAVTLFGLLHLYTWLVLLAGFALMVVRWKMESGHFVEAKSWGGKLWPYLSKTEGAAAYLSPILVVLPAFFKGSGNIGHFILLSYNASNLIAFRRKVLFLEYSARGEIYASVWDWKWWHNIGNSKKQSTLFFYIHFREILHRFVLYMNHHPNYHRNGGRTPPV